MKYASYLSGKVGKRILDLHAQQQHQLSLLAEVSVMSDLCGKALEMYAKIEEKIELTEDVDQQLRLRQAASAYVVEMVNQVRDITVAAARVRDSGKSVDMMNVGAVMAEVMIILEEKARVNLHDPEKYLREVGEAMNEKFITVDAVAKTTLTPARLEKEVMAMHDSVPGPEAEVA